MKLYNYIKQTRSNGVIAAGCFAYL